MADGKSAASISRRLLVLSMAVVRWAGAVVPPSRRSEWRQEWIAEIYFRWKHLRETDRLSLRESLDLVGRSLGAMPHALWMWSEEWLTQALRYAMRTYLTKPASRSPWLSSSVRAC